MVTPLLTSLHTGPGPRMAFAQPDAMSAAAGDQRPTRTAPTERPYSVAADLAAALPLVTAGRCTAVPNCAAAATCAATPPMRRACQAAFSTWVRRGMAAADAPAGFFEKWR